MKLTRDEFGVLVDRALDSIPPAFEQYMEGLAIDIEDQPDEQTLEEMGIEDPYELLGLYRGVPLTDRSVEWTVRMPDSIVVYQRNIERVCRTRKEIIDQVRKTILHEVGHHFGMDEDELDEKGYA